MFQGQRMYAALLGLWTSPIFTKSLAKCTDDSTFQVNEHQKQCLISESAVICSGDAAFSPRFRCAQICSEWLQRCVFCWVFVKRKAFTYFKQTRLLARFACFLWLECSSSLIALTCKRLEKLNFFDHVQRFLASLHLNAANKSRANKECILWRTCPAILMTIFPSSRWKSVAH